jgi:hypothetical protein
VPSSEEDLATIRMKIEGRVNRVSPDECLISLNDVDDAVKKLKPMKGDGDCGFSSSHLLHSSVLFRARLAALFTAMTKHGHQPAALLSASIISIPKDFSKSLCDSSNYRGIALCSSIAKVFDLIFLARNKASLKTDDLQFAFKQNMGTAMCTLVLHEGGC